MLSNSAIALCLFNIVLDTGWERMRKSADFLVEGPILEPNE